jgi:hypothetical protein
MERRHPRPNLLIRPNGQVELLDPPGPAVTGSYASALPRLDAVRNPHDRRSRPRCPDGILRGRIVDLWG